MVSSLSESCKLVSKFAVSSILLQSFLVFIRCSVLDEICKKCLRSSVVSSKNAKNLWMYAYKKLSIVLFVW